jgi:hypothetical protein
VSDIVLTAHSIDRFRTRHVPHLTHEQAHRELKALLPRATLIQEKSPLGQDQWFIEEPYGVLLVCKNDPKVGIVAVTSLTQAMRGPSADEIEDMRAAALRNMAARAALTPRPTRAIYVKQPYVSTAESIARREAADAENRRLMAARSAEVKAAKTSKRDAAHAKDVAIRNAVEQIREAKERAHAQHLAHCVHMDQQATQLKNLLRIVMLAAEPFVGIDAGITEAWDTIAQEQPGLITDRFLSGRKKEQ